MQPVMYNIIMYVILGVTMIPLHLPRRSTYIKSVHLIPECVKSDSTSYGADWRADTTGLRRETGFCDGHPDFQTEGDLG